jgi:hypothetical protein
MSRSKDFYLLLLEHALIEMRACPHEGNLDLPAKLADMFHNVPGSLRLPWTEEREEHIHNQILEKARLYGLAEALDRWEKHVAKKIAESENEPALANS